MRGRSVVAVSMLLAVATGVTACQQPPGWSPLLEETNVTFLSDVVGRALENVEGARAALPGEPDAASESLAAAARDLQQLLGYYLPLFQAREHALNAVRLHAVGKDGEALERLESVQTILTRIEETEEGAARAAMAEPLQELVAARLAIEQQGDQAAAPLERLAWQLDNLALRGGLVLD